MNRHAAHSALAALLVLSALFTIAVRPAAASTPAATRKTADPAATRLVAVTSPPGTAGHPKHFFPVNDEKGLLLTCVAPEIETNPDTDLFSNCTLAPGRTLDDVMHSFIQAIHAEQKEHARERAEWLKSLDEKPEQTLDRKAERK